MGTTVGESIARGGPTPPGGRSSRARPAIAPVRVLRDAWYICVDTLEGLVRAGVPLLTIALTSFAVEYFLIRLGATVAITNGPAGIGIFVVGVATRLVLLGLGMYVAASAIHIDGQSVALVGARLGHAPGGHREGFSDTIRMSIVPMVVLYAAWNQINWDIHRFLLAKYIFVGDRTDYFDANAPSVDQSNIDFREGWKFYIPWAIGLWLVKLAVDQVANRTSFAPLDFVVVVLECSWVVMGWLVLSPIIGQLSVWWNSRTFLDWIDAALSWIVGWLHLDLPELLANAVAVGWQALVVVSTQIVWPLVWVAVVGLLVGWSSGDLDTSPGAGHAQRSVRALSRLFNSSTREIREKFYPLVSVARVMLRAGPLPMLTVALLYALLMLAMSAVRQVAMYYLVPAGGGTWLGEDTVVNAVEILAFPLRACFLVACFAMVLRFERERATASRGVS